MSGQAGKAMGGVRQAGGEGWGGVSVGGVAQKIPLRPGGGLEGNSAG